MEHAARASTDVALGLLEEGAGVMRAFGGAAVLPQNFGV